MDPPLSGEEIFRDEQIKIGEGLDLSLTSVRKDPPRYPNICHLVEAVNHQSSLPGPGVHAFIHCGCARWEEKPQPLWHEWKWSESLLKSAEDDDDDGYGTSCILKDKAGSIFIFHY